jgi:acyl transferase domain-containing protein/NADPH:quinone reductase-like Zn-dependent oxidoreductase/NAD(P)-dependent dehydrogenase (short-subunit alcohol dehydrogenase family)/aryl carrier-like protein
MSTAPESTDYRALLKRAVLKLDELQSKLDRLHEPIAIIGLSCRMPRGANDPEAFWQLLHDGVDGISEMPRERWNVDAYYDPNPGAPGKMYTRWGGFLDSVDKFDPNFFGIAPREALKIDPQQRLLLEVAWEALERAGQAPSGLVESRTGVFVGIGASDYSHLQTASGDPADIDCYFAAGIAQSIASGRISYILGLQGPSISMDTACSSSLLAVHLACQSLRLGECDMALAGGVNLLLSPLGIVATCQTRMLSADGHCKTFDASADGYTRAEGCAVIVLKRLSDAKANGDNILALLLGTAANQDGRSNGLTAPNGSAQEAVIRDALAKSQVNPASVSYVETHGTGTSLGDPIEVQALGAVLGDRPVDTPLLIGAVKTNIGHPEAAAGIAGLVKVVLALQHNLIPPTLHVKKLNPLIPWERLPIKVVTQPTPWPSGNGGRIAGVSSFGFSGTNVHVVIQEAPVPEDLLPKTDRPLHLFSFSAKNEAALRALAGRFAQHLKANPHMRISDVCFAVNAGRSHFNHRAAAITASSAELSEDLSTFASGQVPSAIKTGWAKTSVQPEIVFLFAGQGAQRVGMGRRLYETQPTFRKILDRCDALLRPYLEKPLLSILYPEAGDPSPLDETRYAQPALFALEYALAELWRSWGIMPSVVMGHSVGEYAAACVAGVFSLEDGLKLIAERGRLMQALPKDGKMAVVFAGPEAVSSAILPCADKVAIAALNGPDNTVLSGDGETVGKVLAKLEAVGIKSKPLTVSHAFHSPLMEPILDDFERAAGQVAYSPARIGLISNLSGRLFQPTDIIDARYWRSHLREPVQFAAGIETLHQQGLKVFVEIGPDSTLSSMGRRCAPSKESVWLPSLRQGRDDWQQILETLAALYTGGVDVDWSGFDRDYPRRRVVLPAYPFERERYWTKAAELNSPLLDPQLRDKEEEKLHPLLGRRLRSALKEVQFENRISLRSQPFLKDHQFFGTAVFPATAYMEMALAAAGHVFQSATPVLEEVKIHQALLIPDDSIATLQLIFIPQDVGRASFEIFSAPETADDGRNSWTLHVTGKASIGNHITLSERASCEDLIARCQNPISTDAYYQMCADRGVDYGPGFQRIETLRQRDGEAIGHLRLSQAQLAESKSYRLHPALFDACLQVFGATLAGHLGDSNEADAYMPVKFDSVRVHQSGMKEGWCHALFRKGNGKVAETIVGDLRLLGDGGDVIAEVEGVNFRPVHRQALLTPTKKQIDNWLYAVAWRPMTLAGSTALEQQQSNRRGLWIVLADNDGVGTGLAKRFEKQGESCILVFPGKALEHAADGHWRIDPARPEDFERLVKKVTSATNSECSGVIHLWSLGALVSGKTALPELQQGERLACGSTLNLVQALVHGAGSRSPRLWLVTRGAQAVKSAELPAVVQASLWGLGAAVSVEHPTLRCSRIDLDPDCAGRAENDVVPLFAEIQSNNREDQIAIRQGQRYVARLVRSELRDGKSHIPESTARAQAQRLDIAKRGSLDNLKLVPMTRREPGRGEVEIRVLATGLNFRDVLNALDLYPGDAGRMGNECVGKISAVGEGVDGLKIGDEVVAVASDCFATYVTANAQFVLPKPERLSMAEAATIPITFLTAFYALNHLAHMSAGDRVLIHAAAGGVGMAAVKLAQRVGAEIFATAGSAEKREYLKSIGVEYVMDSRSLSFADEVAQLTRGEGVDIVLNSLTGEAIPKSLGLLRTRGRFLEIGKSGIWDERKVSELRPDISYDVIYLGQTIEDDPALVRSLFVHLADSFAKGDLRPLPLRAFALEDCLSAFRHMARAKHIGKVVITQQPDEPEPAIVSDPIKPERAMIDGSASYLVTGGLGALGLHVAKWLVRRGARSLLLVGRHDPSAAAREVIEALEGSGTRVQVCRCDISQQQDVCRLIHDMAKRSVPALRGIVHCAGVLDDDILLELNWERFARVMAPKIDGSWNLHQLTKNLELDFFVLFSSLASVFGAPAQGNYAAANAFMDGLAHYRQTLGLRTLSINWGAWAEGGMVTALGGSGERRMARHGVTPISPEQGTETMECLLHSGHAQATVLPIAWRKFLSQYQAGEVPPLFSEMIPAKNAGDELQNPQIDSAASLQAREKHLTKEELFSADPAERPRLLESYLSEQIIRLLGLSSGKLDSQEPLINFGFDSLMAVELKSRIEADLGFVVTVAHLLQGASMSQVSGRIIDQMAVATPLGISRETAIADRIEITL